MKEDEIIDISNALSKKLIEYFFTAIRNDIPNEEIKFKEFEGIVVSTLISLVLNSLDRVNELYQHHHPEIEKPSMVFILAHFVFGLHNVFSQSEQEKETKIKPSNLN